MKFDSRSQLAPRIQDALGRMGRGGQRERGRGREGREFLSYGDEAGTTDPSSLCISPLGVRRRSERRERKKEKGYEKNMKERNRH